MPNRCLVVSEQLPTSQWCLHSLLTIARFECSYHGWQFRGSDGRATVIPQADDEKSLATAVASRRSCCAVHPCAVSPPNSPTLRVCVLHCTMHCHHQHEAQDTLLCDLLYLTIYKCALTLSACSPVPGLLRRSELAQVHWASLLSGKLQAVHLQAHLQACTVQLKSRAGIYASSKFLPA